MSIQTTERKRRQGAGRSSLISAFADERVEPRDADTAKGDIWAMGITLVALMVHTYAFGTPEVKKGTVAYHAQLAALKERIVMGQSLLSSEQHVSLKAEFSAPAYELLQNMLKRNPAQRPTAEEALASAWLTGMRDGKA